MGKLGAQSRNANMTPEERKESSRKALRVRWDRYYARQAQTASQEQVSA